MLDKPALFRSDARRKRFTVLAPFLVLMVLIPSVSAATQMEAHAWSADTGSENQIGHFVVPSPKKRVAGDWASGALFLLSEGTSSAHWVLDQTSAKVPGVSESGDRFGASSAWGDFNGDGIQDLAIGVPNQDVGGQRNAGAVTVLYGASSGDVVEGVQLHQDSPGVPEVSERYDRWGLSIATGDLDNDGYDDLVVGAPYEDLNGKNNAGAITIIYGSDGGATGDRSILVHQSMNGVPGQDEPGDGFGTAIAVAGDGPNAYLAVAAPWEDRNGVTNLGTVTVFENGASLFESTRRLFPGISNSVGPANAGDQFGLSLAGAGDGSLFIGAPYGDLDGAVDAGYVAHFEGKPWNMGRIDQSSSGSVEAGALFGSSIDAETTPMGTVVAIGAPRDDVAGVVDAGSVTVVSPHADIRLTLEDLTLEDADSAATPETSDHFGAYVDLLPSGALFAAAPSRDLGASDSGAGVIFEAPTSNERGRFGQFVHQENLGLGSSSQSRDLWGNPYFMPLVEYPVAQPAPNPEPTPSPTPEPTPSPTPSPTPEPTPYPTPSPTPSAAPVDVTDPVDTLPMTTWHMAGEVYVVLAMDDIVFIGGDFTEIYNDSGDRLPRNYMAALNRHTGEPIDFAPDLDANVRALALSSDEETLYVGGAFLTAEGQSRRRAASYDIESGTLTSFQIPGPNAALRAIAVEDDRVYLGGLFTKIGGVPRSHVAAVDAESGHLDADFLASPNDTVKSIIAGPDQVWLGGDFSRVNGTFQRGIGAVDAVDGALVDTDHVGYPVIALAASETQVFIAGGGPGGRAAAFDRATGQSQWEIASDGNFQAVDVEAGRYVYFGGHYEYSEGHDIDRLTRHDKLTGATDLSWVPRMNGIRSVNALDVTADAIHFGGDFTKVNFEPHEGFAIFTGLTQ